MSTLHWPIDRTLNYGRHAVSELCDLAAPFDRVVDLGAGAGDDLASARRASPGAELHGVELEPDKFAELTRNGIAVHAIDLEHEPLPFEDESVDLVISNQTLEHTKEIFWIFHQMVRVLRVGGHLLVGVPNLAGIQNRILLAAGRQPSVIRTASAHVRGFTIPGLEDFIDQCFPGGLELVTVRGSNFYPLPRAPALWFARRWPRLAWSVFLLWRKTRAYESEFLRYPHDEALETPFFLGGPDGRYSALLHEHAESSPRAHTAPD
jgi:methionine biosynthesis protein MetW